MGEPRGNPAAEAKDSQQQPDSPSLNEFHKAHIRALTAQRNLSALALQHRDMQQELAKAEAEFQRLRRKAQEESGVVYNDQTLSLEPRNK